MLNTLHTVVHHNYFRFNDKFYKLSKYTAMGSPTSDSVVENFLHYFENNHTKITSTQITLC